MERLVWKDIQFTATVVPVHGITREQAAIVEVVHDVALCVPRCRYRDHTRRYNHRRMWRGYIGSIWRSIRVGFSYPDTRTIPLCPTVSVGHVVSVAQQHVSYPAQAIQTLS